MRLYVIPLSTRRALLYGKRTQATNAEPTIIDKLSARANKLWLDWENGDKKWQRKIVEGGNKMFRRISYAEWSLKSVPTLNQKIRTSAEAQDYKVPITYPPSMIREEELTTVVRRYATAKNDMHRKKLKWCLIGMPISAPFGLIPIIPNIPFFYLAFRAYSHWKALKGAEHLQFILDKNLLKPDPLPALDVIYAIKSPHHQHANSQVAKAAVTDAKDGTLLDEVMVIDEPHAKEVSEILQLPQLAVEIERAFEQVSNKIKVKEQAKKEKEEQERQVKETKGTDEGKQ